jgi:type I restriction enzyme M protein
MSSNSNMKNTLIQLFKNCLNILRDNEGLTGDKALRNLSYLLILKLIEPHLNKDILIDSYDFDFNHIQDDMVEKHKKKLLSILHFTNLIDEKEDNLPVNLKYLWEDILSVHPSTKNIFLKGKSFDIQHKTTFKKLIEKISSIDLSNTDYDILGNAYEEVIQDIMTGKVLGQFFTQPIVKNIMIELINPEIFSDGRIETCCDPTMGTGGFLITYLNFILKKAKINNINPDWNFIKNEGLFGKEIEPDTFQLAVSNLLISSGYMFENLERGDSIRNPINKKFDTILANPPFGIKGLKYDSFQYSLKDEYIPIKSDNAVSLFLQSIIYMLKINGRCAIVLPDGQDLYSKTNKSLLLIREYLLKTCDLKEIIYLPQGIFNYTSIKTCIFYFIKKKEGNEILNINIKNSKTKETTRIYNFKNEFQTNSVSFYQYDLNKKLKDFIISVSIDKIKENDYSLNYLEYLSKDNTFDNDEKKMNTNIQYKSLNEICNFLAKSKRNAKYGQKEGNYPFFKSSLKIDSYVIEPDFIKESIIIGDGGEPNVNYSDKFSTTDHCYVLQNKNNNQVSLKYIYYYLFHNLDMMKDLYTGVAIKNISKYNLENLKIPIPSLEDQNKIIKKIDELNNENRKLKELIKKNEDLSKQIIIDLIN